MRERKVSGVMGDIDRGRKEGVVADGNGDEEPVQPRGTGEGRKRVSGDVVVGVGVVVDFANIKAIFKFSQALVNSVVGRRGLALVVSDRFATKLRSPQTKVGTPVSTAERESRRWELKANSPPDLR